MADLVGTTLGPYHILALLGAGGMGQVYRARDPRLEREVAIKVLTAALAQEPGYLERFQREARAVAQLSHPNIVPVYDFGEQGGTTYLVMPLIAGGTLRDQLAKRGMFSLQEATHIIEQVASALQHAHERGLIHRDVKPANILMSADGRALLSDFGIVRVARADTAATLTRLGAFVGSPDYAAPEMVLGQPIDHRVDIYALGLILYQMLTGRPPFASSTPVSLLMMQAQQPPPPPRSLNPAIPPAVEAVMLKALAKAPADRYASAAAFSNALKAASTPAAGPALAPDMIAGLPTVASPAGPPLQTFGSSFTEPGGPAAPLPAPGLAASPPSQRAAPTSRTPATPPPSGWASPASGPAATPAPPPTFMTSLPDTFRGAPVATPPQLPPTPQRRRLVPLLLLALVFVLVAGGGGALAFAYSTGAFKSTATTGTSQSPTAKGTTATSPTSVPSPSPTPLPTYYYMAHIFVLQHGDLQNGDTADRTIGIGNARDYANHEGPNGDLYQMGTALNYGWQYGTATRVRNSAGQFAFVILVDRFDSYQHAQQYFQHQVFLFQSKTTQHAGEQAASGIIPENNQETYQLFVRDRNIFITISTVPQATAQDVSQYFLAVAQALIQRGEHCKYDLNTLKPIPNSPSDCN